MTELGLALLALYLLEGVRWIPRTSIACSRRPWGGFSLRRARTLRRDGAGGLLMPEPWAPCLGRFPAHAWPAAIAPDGVVFVGRAEGKGTTLDWKEVPAIRSSGSRLFLEGRRLADAGSAAAAEAFRSLLQRVASASPEDRAPQIRDALHRSFDAREARRRIEGTLKRSRYADWLAWAIAANMALGPVASHFVGSARVWPAWLTLHLLLAVLAARVFWRGARRLRTLGPTDRFQDLVLMVLYPPAAARFQDSLGSCLLTELDPLAAAAASRGRIDLPSLARTRLASIPPREDGSEILRWFDTEVAAAVDALLHGEGISPEAVHLPPLRESGAESYCPRCRTQYRVGCGVCPDCPRVCLVGFPAGPRSHA